MIVTRPPRVLIATPRMIYPAVSGGELRVLSLIKRLSGRYRFLLLTFLEPESRPTSLAAALSLERELGLHVRFARRNPQEGGRRRWLPDAARWFTSSEMARMLREICVQGEADLAHLEFGEMGQYAEEIAGRIPLAITEHDTSALSPWRSYLRPARGRERLGRPWNLARQWLYERRALSVCDRVVTVSEADRRRLSWLVPADRVAVVPTGVDLEYFAPRAAETAREGAVVFLGHYPHYPNEDAAVFLGEEIMPRLKAISPGATLTLAGSQPTDRVAALRSEFVRVTGTVPDVRPFLASAQVFAAPLRVGYGIKGKLLEAFAMGVPAVATPRACEGMPGLRDGRHVLMAESAKEFARKINELLQKPELRRALAAEARRFVETSFGWDLQAERLARVYDELLLIRKFPLQAASPRP